MKKKSRFDYEQERKEMFEELKNSNDKEERACLRGMIAASKIEEYKQYVEGIYK